MQVVDDAAEAAENNSAEEALAPPKSDSKRALARAQANLACAAKTGTLRDGTRTRIYDCFGALGVKVPSGTNRRQARDVAMQQALPFPSRWTPIGSPQQILLPLLLHHRTAHNRAPKCPWMTCMDSLTNDTAGIAVLLCFCMLAVPMPMVLMSCFCPFSPSL